VQVGITTITEVVQVKRMQNTITRPYIDQLRGALPYHKAIRGTLITTGKFAAKCAEAALFPGAAPITLIDGDRLLELLIENNVGIRRSNAVELLDVDLQLFDELEMD
ncbi:restriction endonuclease, partial [Escherichia coli]|nr:restriction endonuclease [Escherichia coli]